MTNDGISNDERMTNVQMTNCRAAILAAARKTKAAKIAARQILRSGLVILSSLCHSSFVIFIALMKIGLVRRGCSASGGAESYLKRFAEAARAAGHACVLFTSEAWPPNEWPFGELHRVGNGETPR